MGGDVDEEEEEEEKPVLLLWLGERLLWNPLQVTIDICEDEQMMILVSSKTVAAAEGDAVTATLLLPVAAEDCEARGRQCLFSLLTPSSRAE